MKHNLRSISDSMAAAPSRGQITLSSTERRHGRHRPHTRGDNALSLCTADGDPQHRRGIEVNVMLAASESVVPPLPVNRPALYPADETHGRAPKSNHPRGPREAITLADRRIQPARVADRPGSVLDWLSGIDAVDAHITAEY